MMKTTVRILSAVLLLAAACPAGAQTVRIDSLTTSANTRKVGEEDLERSFGLDLRSRLIGRIPGLDVIEHDGQSLYSTSNLASPWFASSATSFISKGWSSIPCFVDGFPVPFQEFLLDPNQIESVEFITDVSDKGSLSPLASSGAIFITTKSGAYNTPMKINVTAASGISFVDKIPEWVDGVTFARLNNLARGSAGYTTLYSEEQIAGFAKGDPFDLRTPNVDYKSLMIRNWKPTTRFGVNAWGGSANVKYNVSLNALNDGDLFKVGPVADYNKINLSTSVTAKIGPYIEARAAFLGLVGVRRGNRANLYSYRQVPAVAFPLMLGRSLGQTGLDADKEGSMIYTVSRTYTSNPYALTTEGGFFSARSRSGMFMADLKLDLGFLTQGLSTRTSLNFGSFYYLNVGKSNDYIAYYWDADAGLVDLSGHVGTKQSSKSVLSNATYQSLNVQQDLNYDRRFGDHQVHALARYYLSNAARSGNSNYERLQMGVLRAEYIYKGLLAANVSLQYAGATPYAPSVRYKLFPTAGISYQPSSHLKLYAQAGRIGYADVFASNYLYEALYDLGTSLTFGPATAYQWFGSDKQTTKATTISRLANPSLTWPTTTEVDLGGNLVLDNGLRLSLMGYLIYRDGNTTNTMSELITAYGMSGIAYYTNYNLKRTIGGELTLGWSRKMGDWKVDVEGSLTSWRTVNVKVANDYPLYEWQRLSGRDENAYTGYVCIGRFETPEQLSTLPKLDETGTQIGDLMYQDLNGDGKIDTNDQRVIGNSNPWLRGYLNLSVDYKDFSFTLTGTGHALSDVAFNSEYFWNGWGDGNYSKFVADNIGGAYPRLSYDKSSTNFVMSDFWLRRNAYFKIKSVELSYTWHPSAAWIESVRFSLTGGNLLTLTGLEYVDPEDINAGVTHYPFYRSIMAGVKFTF